MFTPFEQSPDAENFSLASFRLVREVGEGRTSVVYEAERTDFAQRVAIKLFHHDLALGDLIEGTKHELSLLGALNHPNIVQALAEGQVENRHYLVMEFVDGEPIDVYCDARKLILKDRIGLLVQALEGLEHAHNRLIAHRDLKPANIFVNSEGVIKILDFGSAAVKSTAYTPDFASPEQRTRDQITLASDIYSMGLIARILLSGCSPKAPCAETPSSLLAKMKAVDREKIAELRGETSRALNRRLRGDLDAILLKALQVDPNLRYSSAEAFRLDLLNYLASRPVIARQNDYWIRASRWGRRNSALAGLFATTALVLLVCILGVTWQSIKATHERHLARERLRSLVKLTGSLDGELYESVRSLPDAGPPRASLLDGTRATLDSISSSDRDDPALVVELAAQYGQLAQLEQEQNERTRAENDLAHGIDLLLTVPRSSSEFGAAQREIVKLQETASRWPIVR